MQLVHLLFNLFSDGRKESVMFDKITSRISKLCYGLNSDFIEPVRVPSLVSCFVLVKPPLHLP